MKKNLLNLMIVVSLFTPAFAVQAATVFFGEDIPGTLPPSPPVPAGGNAETARNNFLSQLASHSTEDFESFSAGNTPPLSLSFGGSAGTITATLNLTAGGFSESSVRNVETGGGGRYATSGSNYFNNNRDEFSITFPNPVTAFGFYATDAADDPVGAILSINLGNGSGPIHVAGPGADPAIRNGAVLFFGVIDANNPFSTISFLKSDLIDSIGYDDMIVGTVPIPAAFPLFGSVLGLIGFLGWKRKKAA